MNTSKASLQQEQFWLLSQINQQSSAANLCTVFKLSGEIYIGTLVKSFKYLLKKHSVLRTVFQVTERGLEQRVLDETDSVFKMNDLVYYAEDSTECESFVQQFVSEPFDVENGPLFRAKLIYLNESNFKLVLVWHHCICDLTTKELFCEELGAFYNSICLAKPITSIDKIHEYENFSRWQADWLTSSRHQVLLKEWKSYVESVEDVLNLPLDYPMPANRSYRGSEISFEVPDKTFQQISDFSRQNNKTVFQVLLGVYLCILQRYSCQDEFVVGIPYTNRIQDDFKRSWGCFVNILPLRFKFDRACSFFDLLENITDSMSFAKQHQEVPYLDIVKNTQNNNSSSVTPLFRVGFTLDRPIQLDLHGVEAEFQQVHCGGSQLDLMMYFSVLEGTLIGRIEYNTDIISIDSVKRMWNHYVILTDMILTAPHREIGLVSILTTVEKQMFFNVNKTFSDYDKNVNLNTLFKMRVAEQAEKIAFVFKNKKLTFKELDDQSEAIAAALCKNGVQKGSLIGLMTERTPEMVAGIFGILKAGCAYVPIDPEYPTERIRSITEDASITVVVIHSSLQKKIETIPVIPVKADQCDPRNGTVNLINTTLDSSELIYAIFTSGSTGKPKGVPISHRSVVNILTAMANSISINNNDIVIGVVPVTFDVSVPDMFHPVVNGGITVVVDRMDSSDGLLLAENIRSNNGTIMQATPSTIRLLLSSQWNGDKSLKILCGGEPVTRDIIVALIGKVKELWNVYGPTETTVWSCFHHVKNVEDANIIGKPFNNTQVLVVDENLQSVPIGIPGELLIGGDGVSKGYLNRPELNNDKFLKISITDSDAPVNFYRTGDIVKWHPNGTLEYLHRSDNQVKLRGFRIELNEIENVIEQSGLVSQSVVIPRNDISSDVHLTAYLLPCSNIMDEQRAISEIKEHISNKLPKFMHPSFYVVCKKLPLTSSGKIDRKKLPKPDVLNVKGENGQVYNYSQAEKKVVSIWEKLLNTKNIPKNLNFFDAGGTSVLAAQLAIELQNVAHERFPVAKIFQYPTIEDQARIIDSDNSNKQMFTKGDELSESRCNISEMNDTDIAVVGLSCRFPGADDIKQYWEILSEGKETLTFFDSSNVPAGVDDAARNRDEYVFCKGIINDFDLFDPAYFGLTPQIAEITDPQIRVFLQQATVALDDAGYNGNNINNKVGIFAGIGYGLYLRHNIMSRPDITESIGELQIDIGNERDYLTTRLSHALNLTGPSINISTACSTSLVAIILASQSVLRGDCTMAIAGGSNITFPIYRGHLYQEGSIHSRDGHCRPFDKLATGTTFSDGAGVVVLKKLSDALRDRNVIYAVIKGGAINNDGSKKVSYSAPGVDGQIEVLTSAFASAGITPESLTYIEAHGTATPLGDPIEIEALTQAFRKSTDKTQFCAIGSVKGNIGHTAISAGVAGFIKTVLMLYHKTIVPSVNYKEPNPAIDFKSSPFFVNTDCVPWESVGKKRFAGVSSFGFGGTNAHTILEEPPERESGSPSRIWQILTFSAKSIPALETMVKNFGEFTMRSTGSDLSDCAFTLQTGRPVFQHRFAIIGRTREEVSEEIVRLKYPISAVTNETGVKPLLVFMFPGQGNQYINMGNKLYRQEPVFREAFDQCVNALKKVMEQDLREVLFVEPGEVAKERLRNTFYAQTSIFAVEYALASLWMEWGLKPDLLIGHSIGEFVAATIAGIMSIDHAAFLVANRAKIISQLPSGSMLSVRLSEEEVRLLGRPEMEIASINSPRLCVVSGQSADAVEFSKMCEEKGIICRSLHTSHAFHSAMMEPAVHVFKKLTASVKLSSPRIPVISTVTGKIMTDTLAIDPEYWARHMRVAVRFSDAIRYALNLDGRVGFLEVGPRATSTIFARQQIVDQKRHWALASLGETNDTSDELKEMLHCAAKLWEHGLSLNWKSFYKHENRNLVSLPSYPFECKKCWIEPVNKISETTPEKIVSLNKGEKSIEGKSVTFHTTMKDNIKEFLAGIIAEAIGCTAGIIDMNASLLQLGMDSLFLTQLSQRISSHFGIEVTMRQLMRTENTIEKLSKYIKDAK